MPDLENIAEALNKYRKQEGENWKKKLKDNLTYNDFKFIHKGYSDLLFMVKNLFLPEALEGIKADATEDEMVLVLKQAKR